MPTLHDTRTLMAVGNALDAAPSFLLDKFFPNVFTFDTEKVDIDLIDRSKRLAMFVQRGNPSEVRANRGYTTRSYTPPYIKEKSRLDPSKPLKRRAGERPSGELSAGERYDAHIADMMEEHNQLIRRRLEWMASTALVNGSIVVSGDNVSDETISFGRSAGQAVTAGTLWDAGSGEDPVGNLTTWMTQTSALSGATPTDVVLGAAAAAAFLANADVQARLDNRGGVGGSMDFGPQDGEMGVWLGRMGALNFWLYSAEYTDSAGSAQKFIPDNSLIMTGPGLEGTQAYGAIEDPEAGFVATEIFASMFPQYDPPGTFVMSQSAPLIVPVRPNASLKAVVTS